MQVGEERLTRAQHRDLDRLRLLDLDDHVGPVEDRLGVRRDARALAGVLVVGDRRALTRALLDQHLMAVLDQFADSRRRQCDAVLIGLDLSGDADSHVGTVPFREC